MTENTVWDMTNAPEEEQRKMLALLSGELTEVRFSRLRYGTWAEPSEKEAYLEELASTYFQRCDAYDARVCTSISPRTGEPIPTDGEERRLIEQNAYQVMSELIAHSSVSRDELRQAIQNYARLERR